METHELMELIKKRRSIRKFTSQPVPDQVIQDALEAGIWAPTACNQAPVRFVVIKEQSTLRILNKVKLNIINPQAAIIVILDLSSEYYRKWYQDLHTKQNPILDVGAAVQNMALVIESHGLASCWASFSPYIAYNDYKTFFRRFRLPSTCRITSALFLGYPGQKIDIHQYRHHQRIIDRGPVEKYIINLAPRILLGGAHPEDFDNLGSQAMTNGMKRLIEHKYPNAFYAQLEYPWANPWKFFPSWESLNAMPNGQLNRFLEEVKYMVQVGKLLRDEREIPGCETFVYRLKKWLKPGIGILKKSLYKPSFPVYNGHLNDPLTLGTCPLLPDIPEGSVKRKDGWLETSSSSFPRMLRRQLPALLVKRFPGLAMLLFRYQARYIQPAYLSRLSLLSWADTIFFDGNGLFSDAYAWSRDLLLRFLAECLTAKRLGAEVYIVNQTVSVSVPWIKEIIAYVYNEMDGIVTRESFTREKLTAVGVSPEMILEGADAATWADYSIDDLVNDASLSEIARKCEGGIGLFIRGDLKEDVHMWAEIVNELAALFQRPIVYIPSSRDDMPFAKAIAGNSPLLVIENLNSYRRVSFLIQKMHLVISSRYHPIYFSIMAGTPFAAIRGNTFKNEGLLKLFEYPLPVVDEGETYKSSVLGQVKYIMEHHDELKEHIHKYREILRVKAETNIDVAQKINEYSFWISRLKKHVHGR
ncbi:MAG: nitroreductase family protein [Acidobacteria bacterium]|jgi:nitroreductase/polysaccharide pyruvyl transferase WcaK-like protein|nr:nitroreductase family protein [Acidobacteriota bacterium]